MNLIFCQSVSIVKFKSQKVGSGSVDICGNGNGKTWRGWIPPSPTPSQAEIGLTVAQSVRSRRLSVCCLEILFNCTETGMSPGEWSKY